MPDEKQTRTLSLAGVQLETRNGEIEANLAHAEHFVALARERGAQLILCPEFLAAGYVYDASLWEAAEPQGGPTERWLRRMAIEHPSIVSTSAPRTSKLELLGKAAYALSRARGRAARSAVARAAGPT